MSNFNVYQQQAIDTENHDILVSAGAGSGKTSVMIERIARNLIEGKVDVDKLLVVTFTNAAAAEMRQKLERKLNEVLANPETTESVRNRVTEQIGLLGQSDICTLHKFCQTIIKKYFYTIDLDPALNIGEESETSILRARVLNDMMRELAEVNDSSFLLLSGIFDDKRSFDKIKNYIYKIHIFLTNQPDIEAYKERVNEAYSGDLDNNKLTQIINQYMIEMAEYFVASFKELKAEAERLDFEKIIPILAEYIETLSLIKRENTFTQNHFAVFNMPPFRMLNPKANDAECLDLKNRASDLKKKCKAKLDDLMEKILISPDLNKISQDLDSTKAILDAMLNLVENFEERYLAIKKERNILDFSDLEHYAHLILTNPEVSAEIRNKYQQIYVDEYQDVNDIQEEIVSLVHSSRDLFLVGDVKQSIYGFRNTNPQIFVDKQCTFSDENNDETVAISLNYNYRTDQKILDFVNFVFGKLMTKDLGGIDYNPDHEMRSGLEFKSVEGSLPQIELDIVDKPNIRKSSEDKLTPEGVYRVSTAPTKEEEESDYARSEGVVIAQKITQFMTEQKVIYDARTNTEREITFGDITLLCRGRSDAVAVIVDTLTEFGIPVAPLDRDSVFKEYEVKVLYSYLNLVNNVYNDIYLASFLTSPVVGMDENALARVRACESACVNFYDCVFKYEENDEIAKKIKLALDLIQYGAESLLNGSIYDLLTDFCEKTGYLGLVGAMPDGMSRVKNVKGYINSFNGKIYNTDLSVYLNSVEEAEDAPQIAPEYSLGDNVVHVETMHHSKGLEYPIVFLVDTGHGFNKDDKKGDFLLNSNLGIGMYKYDSASRTKSPTISLSAIKIAMDDKAYAENLRLLYVAMTRAKNHLVITGCCDVEKLNSSTSPFAIKSSGNFLELILCALSNEKIEELVSGSNHLIVPLVENNNMEVFVYPKVDYTKFKKEKTHKNLDFGALNANFDNILAKNDGFVYDFIENSRLSFKNAVTSLNKSAKTENEITNTEPTAFMVDENTLTPISTEQGIAYHKAMQFIDFNLTSVAEVQDYLNSIITEEERAEVDASKIFSAICQLKPLISGAEVYREQQFSMRIKHCELVEGSDIQDEILVQGVIDLVIVRPEGVILLDYKTSGSHNIEKTAQNYYMQLKCYEKAIEGALEKSVAQKFLYFFLQERLILIDN